MPHSSCTNEAPLLPRGGTTGPWETDVCVESTAPAARNRLVLAKVDSMFSFLAFTVYGIASQWGFGSASRCFRLERFLPGK